MILLSSSSLAQLEITGFSLGELIKTGSFTSICHATYSSHTLAVRRKTKNAKVQSLIAKVVPLSSLHPFANYEQAFIADRYISKNLKHDHLLAVLDAYLLTTVDDERVAVFFSDDFAQGGDLLDLLQDRAWRPLSERAARRLYRQFASAVEFMHASGFEHGNIKADKIVLNRKRTVCKLIDYGLTRSYFKITANCERLLENCFCPGAAYLAPEMLTKRYLPIPQRPDSQHYADQLSGDVWSVGVVLFVLLHGRLPFADWNLRLWVASQLAGNYRIDKKLSENAQDFVRLHLLADPEDRPRMALLLDHPWLN